MSIKQQGILKIIIKDTQIPEAKYLNVKMDFKGMGYVFYKSKVIASTNVQEFSQFMQESISLFLKKASCTSTYDLCEEVEENIEEIDNWELEDAW